MANCLKAFIPQLCGKWQGLSDRRVGTETCCVSVFCEYTKSHLVPAILPDSWSTGPLSPENQIQTTLMCSLQTKRDGGQRGIVEILESDNDR